MPVEYVYKITVDDSDLQLTLKNIDTQLSGLAARTAASFDKVGTSMGTGIKKASTEAKKAISDVEKAQKSAVSAADKTDKVYKQLLATELKLAAGGDKVAQEFIKTAAAGAQSSDALAKMVVASTNLTQAQVDEAAAVAQLRLNIIDTIAAKNAEGASTDAIVAKTAEYQGMLNDLVSAKQAEMAATEASANAKRAEAEATAAATAAMAKSQADAAAVSERTEKSYIKLLSAELKLAAGSDEAAQAFIKQATAGAQSADALAMVVTQSTSLTQTQVQQAQTVAFLNNQIQTLTAAMGEEGADTEALTGRISEYQSMLERIINTRQEEKAAADASIAAKKAEAEAIAQATSAAAAAQAEAEKNAADAVSAAAQTEADAVSDAAAAQSRAAVEADKANTAKKNLLVTELKLAAGTDKAAKTMIVSTAAGAENAEALLKAVAASGQFSHEQIASANSIARLRGELTEASAALTQEGADVDAVGDRINSLTGKLNEQIDIRDRAVQAARDQAQAEREAGEAVDKAAGEIDDSLGEVSEEAERNEQAFIKLLSAELKVAAGADQTAQDLVKVASAAAQTSDALLATVGVSNNLSAAQIDHAVKVATLRESIQLLTVELDKEGANAEELTGQIAEANGELERMAAAQEAAAAAAQNQREMADEAVAAITANKAAMADAQKDQAKQEKLTAMQQRKANREFTKLAKSFPEIKQGLVELTGTYGTFKTVVGRTGQATGPAQQELHQLFKDNPKFARELELLTTKYGKFTATVQRADFGPRMKSTGQQVRQLGFALQRMGITGVAAFGEIFAALGPIGLAIGAIVVPIIAVTKALKKLADTAVREFKKITKEAFEAGRAFETTEASFKAIFAGADSSVVEAALYSARMESERLGVTLEEILPKILPKVGSLEDAYKIAELIPGLAASAVDLGPSDALRSIIEALAGDLVSLRKAFEIPVDGIRRAQEEFGLVEGLVIGLSAELENMGLTFEDQAETINIKIGQMQQRWQTFKQIMGAPLVDAVKEQFDDFFTLLDDQSDTLHGIASMIGEIIGQLGTEVGGNLFELLEKIDPTDIETVANSLGRIAQEVIIFAEDMTGFFEHTESIADFVSGIADWTEKTRDQIAVLSELKAITNTILNPFKGLKDVISDLTEGVQIGDKTLADYFERVMGLGRALESLRKIIAMVQAGFAMSVGIAAGFLGGIDDLITGAKSFKQVANDAFRQGAEAAAESIEKSSRSMREWTDVTIEGSKVTEEFGDTALATADDILAMDLALRRLGDSEDDFVEKQNEINDKIAEFARNAETKFQSMLTDLGRDLLDAHIANQRKLVDIQTKNLQEIDNIKRQHDNDIIAAAQSLSDRETDILKKHGLEMAEIEKDLNKERLKIEQDYLDDLERMRAKFDFDMFEAFLANDAKRLAQLRRRQAFEEKEAAKDRDRNLRDADGKADEEREARQSTLEQELQDARIANARTIRDLLTNLELQFQEQEISRKRDVEAQALANKRKEEDMRDSFDRQILDYDDWWKEQHRRTTEGIIEDLEQMQTWVDDRNKLLAEIQGIAEIASQAPLERLREMTAFRVTQEAHQLPSGPGGEPGEIMPFDRVWVALTESDLADATREELEKLFNEASTKLGLPNLAQQQAIELQNLETERLGLHPTPGGTQGQIDYVMGLTEDELKTYVAELIAEMAGIELPESMPEGMIPGIVQPAEAAPGTAIPEGFSFPVVTPPEQQQQSGFYGSGGGFGAPAAPGAAPGYGFPPTLPPDMADFENYFLPGNMMPIPPTYGFDAQEFFDGLDEQTEAQATAELEMRGETHDTVDLAALLAEQRASLHATYMQDEVDQTQIASDAQIEILEKTLAAQREVLAAVRDDPTLQVDVDALEVSIGALEDLIARARDQQAELAAQTAQQEAEAILAAEGIKRDEIEETADTAEDAWLRRKMAADTGLYGEIQASQDAKKEQVDLVAQRLLEQGQMTGDFRTQEYELQTEADEELRELFSESGDEMLDMQYGWWRNLLDAQVQGINSDLNLMIRWLEERQRIWDQMQLTMPGGDLPSLPGDPEGTSGDDPDATVGATLEQLQSLAMGFAQQLGYEMGVWREHIFSLNYDDLLALVYELQDLVGAAGYGLGGGFLPGKKLLVGDRGPEIVEFNQAGAITPLSAFMERPPSMLPDPGSTMNDYSINMKNEFPDPRGLSPSVKAEMENIAANIALKVMGGRRR